MRTGSPIVFSRLSKVLIDLEDCFKDPEISNKRFRVSAKFLKPVWHLQFMYRVEDEREYLPQLSDMNSFGPTKAVFNIHKA